MFGPRLVPGAFGMVAGGLTRVSYPGGWVGSGAAAAPPPQRRKQKTKTNTAAFGVAGGTPSSAMFAAAVAATLSPPAAASFTWVSGSTCAPSAYRQHSLQVPAELCHVPL